MDVIKGKIKRYQEQVRLSLDRRDAEGHRDKLICLWAFAKFYFKNFLSGQISDEIIIDESLILFAFPLNIITFVFLTKCLVFQKNVPKRTKRIRNMIGEAE